MTDPDLLERVRRNVIETYLGLALEVDGTRRIECPHFSGAFSPKPFSFCNFVVGLNSSEWEMHKVLEELRQLARSQRAMRVFAMTGDQPEGWFSELPKAGFVPAQRLNQMVEVGDATVVSRIQLSSAHEESQRTKVAQFMVHQFFAANDVLFRNLVAQATVRARHEIWSFSENNQIRGAAMTVETDGVLGLFNLCVDQKYRGRGIGAEMVRAIQVVARQRGRVVCLQCDERLDGWYRRFRFEKIGEIRSFYRQN